MSDVLDDLGHEDGVEEFVEGKLEDVSRRIAHFPGFVLPLHVTGELRAQIVPSDAITFFSQSQSKITLPRRDIEHADPRLEDRVHQSQCLLAPIRVGAGVAEVVRLAVDFGEIIRNSRPATTGATSLLDARVALAPTKSDPHANLPRRHATPNLIFRDRPRHDCGRSDDRAPANLHSLKHDHVRSHPDV